MRMARLLVADDDPALLDLLAMVLTGDGHAVDAVANGLMAHKRAPEADLLVADVNMPGLDGFSLCRRLRAEGHRLPIVLLTARDSEIDEALGLDLGADDYVHKPFRMRVLQSRIAALLRRTTPPDDADVLEVGSLRLDAHRLATSWRGALLPATVSEFRLLQALAGRPGIVQDRAALMEKMRGDDSVVVDRIIDTYVRRLRRAFESVDPTFDAIETVIGAGYRWREPPP